MVRSEDSTVSDEILGAVRRFHLEQQGRAPLHCRLSWQDNMIIIVSDGIYTATEESLAGTDEGKKIIQSARRELRAITRRDIEARLSRVVGRPILRSYYDLDVRAGERIEIYMLN